MTDKLVVLTTCGSRPEAARLARALVEQRAAGCVNVLPSRVLSVFRWNGKVESAREVLLVIKSSRRRFAALRALVERLHSYEVPEIIALPIAAGSAGYLRWLEECLATPRPKAKKSAGKPRRGGRR